MIETVYKLVRFKPEGGYEILSEHESKEEAQARQLELWKQPLEGTLFIAVVPRPPAPTRAEGESE